MPAKTTEQLFATHSQYLDVQYAHQEDFRNALNEVMPRIYKMGYWRDLLTEHTQDASKGYISLPPDTDSILYGVLDNNAMPTRSLWHDYKLFGTDEQNDTLLNSFIDDGYASSYRDIETPYAYQLELQAVRNYNDSLPTDPFTVDVLYKGSTTGDGFMDYRLDQTNTADTGSGVNISNIEQIIYNNIPDGFTVRVLADPFDDSFDAVTLADLPSGSGTARYRRYRIGNTKSDSSAHLLLKRRWVDVDSTTDLVHMPSNAILKHALLGKLSEDTADIQRAQYHWSTVAQLLDTDTDSYRGSAKPTLHIAPDGVGAGMSGMY